MVFSAVETLTKYTGRGVGRKGFIAFHLPITETNSEIFKTALQCLSQRDNSAWVPRRFSRSRGVCRESLPRARVFERDKVEVGYEVV